MYYKKETAFGLSLFYYLWVSVCPNGGHSAEYNFGEGVIIRPWGPYQVVYHEKDHVGSVRVATNQHGDVLERNDYYPFGMRHRQPAYELSTVNRYQFNGKDKEPYGLTHLSDYGARRYDSQLGRWNEMDPLREKYYSHSPFSFTANNPVRFVDPDGRDWYQNESGATLWLDNNDATVTHKNQEYNNIGSFYNYEMADGSIAAFHQDKMVSQFEVASQEFNTSVGEVRQASKTVEDYIEMMPSTQGKFVAKIVFGAIDDAWIALQSFVRTNPTHLSGHLATPKEKLNAGVMTAASIPGYVTLGSGSVVNAAQFNVMHKGVGVNAATNGGAFIRHYNQTIKEVPSLFNTYGNFGYGLSVIDYYKK